MKPDLRPAHYAEEFPGASLTPEQVEFGRAVERYRREHRRPFPTCSEILLVLKSLGYVKQTGAPAEVRSDGRPVGATPVHSGRD